ncbi:MAG: DUF502 domain-containing protein [Saprospiraceae bacterium]|nr:DUF502 domain-containing protein [Saprospiraceae bacterium]
MIRLRNFLLTTVLGGLVVLLPIAIFFFLAQLLLNLVNRILAPLSNIMRSELGLEFPEIWLNAIAFVIVIVFCFLVGLFIRTRIGKNTWSWFEATYLLKLPLYGTIKETVQQFSGNKRMPFSDVVLVDVFGNDTRMTGFVTDEHESGNVTVFVPTGPNPTNGFIFHVSANQIQRLDESIKTDDAMRTIIGVGVGSSTIMKH